ncbi:MAG: rod shape-determining protein [Synergistaceae bacterium]|jgi:rod shape-determining protein MreB|nr:rod shape-determining protein [Synergistaceae bacterium]
MFKFLTGLFSRDIGIDLGSANTVVYVKGRGVTIDEPSVLAVRKVGTKGKKDIIAFGRPAKKMIGKTPQGIETIRPLQHGVIADFDMTEKMVGYYMSAANQGRRMMAHPRVAICVPACVTEVEKRAVVDATLGAGAREAFVVEEPLAAALGTGLPINEPRGNMVVDIGGGTSEVAVLSLGGVVISNSLRAAGDDIDNAIVSMMRQNYTLSIGESTAEEVKIAIGSVMALDSELEMEVKGRDLMDGLPKVVIVTSNEVRDAIEPIICRIEDMIRYAVEQTPPELVKDIVDQGMVLTGGSSQLRGLSMRFSDVINVPVHMAESPLYSVALGLGKLLETVDRGDKIAVTVDHTAV